MVRALGPAGYGFYLYAPKADGRLRRRWREPYADADLQALAGFAQVCRDAMSGEFFAYSARAVLDGKEFNGCARVGR